MIVRARVWIVSAIGLLLLVGASVVLAQFPQFEQEFTQDRAQSVPENRRVEVMLEQAREQLGASDEVQVNTLELLQFVVETEEDTFSDIRLNSSQRRDAELLLSGLSSQGRQLYEQTYGGEASALLQTARETGSADQLRSVVQKFFLTEAGGEAAYEMAVSEMDRGELLAAARCLDRLRTLHPLRSKWEPDLSERAVIAYLRAGMPLQAADILAAAAADTTKMFQGRNVSVSSRSQAVAWLREELGSSPSDHDIPVHQWLVQGGTPERNASVTPTTPVFDDAWQTSVIGPTDTRSDNETIALEDIVGGIQGLADHDAELQTFPVSEPLVVGETLLFSSYGRLKAIDVNTGEFRWQAADADPVFEYLMTELRGPAEGMRGPALSSIRNLFMQRAWLDATSAAISSDGDRVYEVFDSGMVGPFQDRMTGELSYSHPLSPKAFNRLRAYDIPAEGKLLWEVGGPNGRASLPMAGTFFLGPPLSVDGTLYVLGEERGQVRLFALDPESGTQEWSLPLLNVAADVNDDLDRRLAGHSPSYAGGMLICPTGSGLIVAVDPVQRSLVWGQLYNSARRPFLSQQLGRGFRPGQMTLIDAISIESLLAEERWRGNSITVADRSLLVAPPDQAVLHCLSLVDGSPRWTRARRRLLYVAGVYDGAAILVGERSIESVHLESGETNWSLPIDDPCGRGVRQGNRYCLPLQGSRIATIDLKHGRLLAETPTRTGEPLGNLVAVNGRLLTQTVASVRGFRSLGEIETQLAADFAADPDDPAALAIRGEMRLHAGQSSEGLDDLRASLAASTDDRTKQLVVNLLLERLRVDFAANQSSIPELEQLADSPTQRIRLLRAIATGLESISQTQEAFQYYLQLLSLREIDEFYEHIDDIWSVRLDRWAQGHLIRIAESAPDEDRPALDRQIEATVVAAIDAGHPDTLVRFASTFGRHAGGSMVEDALVELLDPQQSALRAEALYLKRRRTGTPEQRAHATARLIRLYADSHRGSLVRALLDELSNEFSDVVAWEGMTGNEVAQSWSQDETILAALESAIEWPRDEIHVRKQPGRASRGPMILRRIGPFDPLLHDGGFVIHTNGQLGAFDGDGRVDWPRARHSSMMPGMPSANFSTQRGHQALVFLGHQFQLLNQLNREEPEVIFEDEVTSQSELAPFGRPDVRQQQVGRGLRGDLLMDRMTDEYFGNVGPLGDDVFCYQKGGTLYAIDPYTGDELWHVANVRRGSEIFADDEYVVLVFRGPRNAKLEVHIYRAADGQFVAQTELPETLETHRQGADWGRYFLTRQPEGDGVTLAMFDPVTGRNLWERAFPQYHSWIPRDGNKLVVVSKDGQVQVLDPEDGEVEFQAQIELPEKLDELSVLSTPDLWILFTKQHVSKTQEVRGLLPEQVEDVNMINGPAYAFDCKTNELLWSREMPPQVVDPLLPGRWPFLVLSSGAQMFGASNRVGTTFLKLMLIDQRTGETIYEGEGNGNMRAVSWNVSDEPLEVNLMVGSTDLVVRFDGEADTQSDDESADPPLQDEPSGPARRPPAPPSSEPPIGEEK